jgi:hypothetical protein
MTFVMTDGHASFQTAEERCPSTIERSSGLAGFEAGTVTRRIYAQGSALEPVRRADFSGKSVRWWAV